LFQNRHINLEINCLFLHPIPKDTQTRTVTSMSTVKNKSVSAIRIDFFFMGVLLGGWSTRIPELKTALHMNDATLGRTLIGSSLAAIFISRVMGKLIASFGTKKVFYLGSSVFPFGYLLIAFAPNPFFVFLGIFAFVTGYFFLDNPLTIVTQKLEADDGRKYLSGFHAFWSIGTLAAGFFGSFLIGHVKYSYHLAGIAVIVFLVLIRSGRSLADVRPGTGKDAKAKDMPWFGPLGLFIMFIGAGMLCSNSAEFGATDWSALFLRDVLSITGSAYVGAYLAFELGMILSRLLGDRLIHKYGAAKVLLFAGIFGSLSWLTTMEIGIRVNDSQHGHSWFAYSIILLGYFAAGAGVGPLFPGFITLLGSVPGINMGAALSRAFMFSTIGVSVVPASIGFVSDATSLKTGMLIPIALLFVAGLLSRVGKSDILKASI
jgi:MFS family permease